MIDCHNHTLPGIDDGAHDTDMALSMAQCAASDGIETIVCTPHHLNGVFTNSRTKILKAVLELRTRLAEAGVPLQLVPGSEIHLVPELPSKILEGDALTYADRGRAALVELPKHTVPTGAEAILEQLLYQNVTPIIAHPERNSELLRHPDRLSEWASWGCKVQLTGQSCTGDFGLHIQKQSRAWCQAGHVHLIASDAHRPKGRAPSLTKARDTLALWVGDVAAEVLTVGNPNNLVHGEPVSDIQAVAPARRFRREWLTRLLRSN